MALSCLSSTAFAAPDAPETVPTDTAAATTTSDRDTGGWQIWAHALEEYRFRSSGAPTVAAGATPVVAEDDHDLRLYLGAGAVDASEHWALDVAMALWDDLDGRSATDAPSAVASTYDASSSLWFDVYTLAAEYRARRGLTLARLGRQTTTHGLPVVFDGATVEYSLGQPRLQLFAFGGRTAHFFELGADTFEDWMASVGFAYRPLDWLRFELDYRLQLEDTAQEDGVVDHTYGINAWAHPEEWLFTKLWLRGFQDGVQLVGGDVNMQWAAIDLGLDVRAAVQPRTLRQLSETEDPFHAILGPSLPHLKLLVEARKGFTSALGHLSLAAGWNTRLLVEDRSTAFNRTQGRLYLRLDAENIGGAGFFASVTTDYYYLGNDGKPGDEGLITVGGAAGWAGSGLRTEVGTYFQQFKYRYFSDVQEEADVRTVYADVGYKVLDWLSVRARYEFERFDRDVHTVRFTLSQSY